MIKRSRRNNRVPFFFPTNSELLLIKAATETTADEALDHFERWSQSHGFNKATLAKGQILPHVYDRLEEGSKKLLPMVYSNFKALGIDHDTVNQFSGYHRYILYRNRMLDFQLSSIIKDLEQKQIPYYIRKGIAYLHLYYQDFGARQTSDIDIVIEKKNVETFLNDRIADGWNSVIDFKLNSVFDSMMHATTLRKNHCELDLHWRFGHYPLPEKWNKFINKAAAARAGLLTLPDELNLIDSFVHGYMYNSVRPIRWVCDSRKIISQGIIHWETIINYSIDCGMIVPIFQGLNYHHENGLSHIPEEVLNELKMVKESRRMRWYFNYTSRYDNNFFNVLSYSLAINKNYYRAFLMLLKHYKLSWNQRSYINLMISFTVVTLEKIFFKKKIYLKSVRYAE